MTGAAGPSGLHSHEWRRLCTSHKNASGDLCTSLATITRRICSFYIDPPSIGLLLACYLIVLDTHQGVHPIGIGDTVHTPIAKSVLSIAAPDIQDASGCLQLCDGQIFGIDAAVHTTRSVFESDECEVALFVDATNVFNALNH